MGRFLEGREFEEERGVMNKRSESGGPCKAGQAELTQMEWREREFHAVPPDWDTVVPKQGALWER